MTNAYAQLIADTVQFIKDLPEHTFELSSPADCAFFPEQKVIKPQATPLPARSSTLLPSPIAPPLVPSEKPVAIKPEQAPVKSQTPSRLDPPKAQSSLPSSSFPPEIRATLQKIAPHLKLTDQIPEDQTAQRVASAWQEKIPGVDVVLLLLDNAPESIEFIKNLGKAVHTQLAPAKVLTGTRLEGEKKWDLFLEKNTFRLIIATEGMQNYPHLQSHYKAIPSQSQAFLGKTPVITLAPAASYTQSPEQKILLWKRLCQILKS